MPLTQTKPQVIVGMSGGVDSSVAAYLIHQAGYQTKGIFMKNWDEDDGTDNHCTAKEDAKDALQVCDILGLELDAVSFSKEYMDNVFSFFLDEFKRGRTPNPDILCNKEIKFKAFLDHALKCGASFIATGHYAQVKFEGNRYKLLKSKDQNKDQTYFLYTLNQNQLSKTLFPLGELEKPEVRGIAESSGFDNFSKKDSTGICFIGERRFKSFLNNYFPYQQGDIVDTNMKVIGQHDGLMFYTIGQRQGLGIGGTKENSGEPWYVAQKDLKNNRLVAVQGKDNPQLLYQQLEAIKLHWVSGTPPTTPYYCSAKIRYRQTDQPCQIVSKHDGRYAVSFDEKQRAITPGQSIVFYQGDECLGGGIIDRIVE